MPDVLFGIQSHAGALIESVSWKNKIEKHVLKGSDGADAVVHVNNPTSTFNVKGHGTLTVVPGVGTSLITTITGGITVFDEVDYDEKNDGFTGWAYSGSNHPSARVV